MKPAAACTMKVETAVAPKLPGDVGYGKRVLKAEALLDLFSNHQLHFLLVDVCHISTER